MVFLISLLNVVQNLEREKERDGRRKKDRKRERINLSQHYRCIFRGQKENLLYQLFSFVLVWESFVIIGFWLKS